MQGVRLRQGRASLQSTGNKAARPGPPGSYLGPQSRLSQQMAFTEPGSLQEKLLGGCWWAVSKVEPFDQNFPVALDTLTVHPNLLPLGCPWAVPQEVGEEEEFGRMTPTESKPMHCSP